MENNCLQKLSKLLAKNQLNEAFELLEEYLDDVGFSSNFAHLYVSISAQHTRTKEAFELGTISWDQYNISDSQVIVKALTLSKSLCAFKALKEANGLETDHKGNNDSFLGTLSRVLFNRAGIGKYNLIKAQISEDLNDLEDEILKLEPLK